MEEFEDLETEICIFLKVYDNLIGQLPHVLVLDSQLLQPSNNYLYAEKISNIHSVNSNMAQKVFLNLEQIVKFFKVSILSLFLTDVNEFGVIFLEKLLRSRHVGLEVQT